MSTRRRDNRSQAELRNISISFDGLAGVDGSARFAFGSTKALASVSGPIEVRLASEQASKATFEVIVRPLAGIPGTESKATAASLRSALIPSIILTANPRTLIQLVVQSLTPSSPVLESGSSSAIRSNPSLTATLINASSLALLNTASFPMHGVICSAAVARIRDSRTLIVDPSDDELSTLDGGGVFAFIFADGLREEQDTSEPASQSNGQLVWSQWNAVPFTEDEFVLASALAQEAARKILNVFRDAISNSTNGVKSFEEPSKSHSGVKKELPSTQARLSDAMDVA